MTDRVIRVVFETDGAEKNARKLRGELDRVEGKAERTRRSFVGLKTAAAAAFAAAIVRQVTQYGDSLTRIENRLRLVTDSTAQLGEVQSQLFDIAQRTATPLEDLAELYARTAQATQDLGVEQSELVTITQAVSQAARLSGSSQQESAGAIRQFTQALAGGVLRAEEFNSIIEGTPRLARALADSFGVAAGELRQLVVDGEITSEMIVKALLDQADTLQTEFGSAILTVEDQQTRLANAALFAVQAFDEQAGITASVTDFMIQLTDALQNSESEMQLAGDTLSRFFLIMQNGLNVVKALGIGIVGVGEQFAAFLEGGLEGRERAFQDVKNRMEQEFLSVLSLEEMDAQVLAYRQKNNQEREQLAKAQAEQTKQRREDQKEARRVRAFELAREREEEIARREAERLLKDALKPQLTGRGGGGGFDPVQASLDYVLALEAEVNALSDVANAEKQSSAAIARTKLERMGALESLIREAELLAQRKDDLIAAREEQERVTKAEERAERQKRENLKADEAYIQSLREQLEILKLTGVAQAQYEANLRLSADATDEQREAVANLIEQLDEQTRANEEAAKAAKETAEASADAAREAEQFTDTLIDGIAGAIRSGKDLKDILLDVAATLLEAAFNSDKFGKSLASATSAGSGGGGFLDTLFSGISSLLGGGGGESPPVVPLLPPPLPTGTFAGAFNQGGTFIVPGAGGMDRERLMMDVTAGERVTVQPVGSTPEAESKPIIVNVNNYSSSEVNVNRRVLDGQEQINVLVGSSLQNIESRGARDVEMQRNFGVQRPGVNR